jgi:hypothetical protein
MAHSTLAPTTSCRSEMLEPGKASELQNDELQQLLQGVFGCLYTVSESPGRSADVGGHGVSFMQRPLSQLKYTPCSFTQE